ncbi:hypothetical protein DB88DRAFT_497151 [Papiliotrema laurentii]|uniref:Uncharacterized protein n=1 Tax=Papiliotrema laurentii TaxID=5418 RepID=A0AAD9CWV1_PAPLA|nr:hypothetical protein DB88DRAFT_497151 [Papiliotrema laurentii]
MKPAIVPAIVTSQNGERTRLAASSQGDGRSVQPPRQSTYGTMPFTTSPDSPTSRFGPVGEEGRVSLEENRLGIHEAHENGVTFNSADLEEVRYVECESDDGLAETLDVTWKYMSRMYLLVPLITLFFLAALILLITFAWPPNKHERRHGQTYPHPFLWKPLFVGIFAGCTVQTIRVPVYVVVSWLGASPTITTYVSTILHSIIHELIRLSSLPLSTPSPTSGFHSSYYLGLGWGIAEAAWGIVQGYEQLSLYQDIMKPDEGDEEAYRKAENEVVEDDVSDTSSMDEEQLEDAQRADEAELERRVEVLERMRARRDLEEVIGVPFPTINLALHLLWRLDTLLLNLGLTMILSAFYFDPIPIYRHGVPHTEPRKPALGPNHTPSPYLWSVWAVVALIHVGISVLWKLVGRIGIDAVTWGGLIVALGSVFAGLGGWGGLV